MSIRAALFGCGRWGRKLLGALRRHPSFEVAAVVDPDPAALAAAAQLAPRARLLSDGRRLLRSGAIDAALVATPTVTHAAVARQVIAAGVPLMVEKPLCDSTREADELCEALARTALVGMVGHVLCFHPAVQRLVRLGCQGAVGPIRRVVGVRATQSGASDALWTLAPHDLGTLRAIDASPITDIDAAAAGDEVLLDLRLASGLSASFRMTTRAPTPERRLFLYGDCSAIGVDELDERAPLKLVHSHGGAEPPRTDDVLDLVHHEAFGGEPLLLQLDHFAACVARREQPLMSFERAAGIVAAIERAERELLSPVRHRAAAG